MGKQKGIPVGAVPMKRPPVRGDWQIVKMDVRAEGKLMTFLVGAAPVETVLFDGRNLQIKLDENQGTFFAMQFPTDEPVSAEEFLEKLKGLRMAIEDRVHRIVTVDG